MVEKFDVRIEAFGYDAAKGVTVVRLSYVRPDVGRRIILKGVAFVAPQDRHRQTKREGYYQALNHAALQAPASDRAAGLGAEIFVQAVRMGLFSWDVPLAPAYLGTAEGNAFQAEEPLFTLPVCIGVPLFEFVEGEREEFE